MTNREVYTRLWPYVHPYIKYSVLAVIATVIVSAMSGLQAWLIKPVLDDIFVQRNEQLLYILPGAVLATFVVKSVFTYYQSYFLQLAAFCMIRDLRDDVYANMAYMPLSEFHKKPTGHIISTIVNDSGIVSKLGAEVIKGVSQHVLTIIFLLGVLFYRDWKLAIISIVLLPVAGHFLSRYGKRARKLTKMAQAQLADLMKILEETITGIRIVKTFTMEDGERARFVKENRRFNELLVKTGRIASRVSPIMESIGGVAAAVVILYGGMQVVDGSMSAGSFFSFMTALLMMYGPIKSLSNLHNSMQQAMAAAERVFELKDSVTEINDMDAGIRELEGVNASIEYKDICFRYHQDEPRVLDGVNIRINKGEVVALVGSSGGGKTTFVNLLPRFYTPESGTITIDGRDIREYSLRALRSKIAVVTQDTILFNDTLENNIAYGKKEYTHEQVVAAAKAAHADGFIDKMPHGYGTEIGEKGIRLSGGEKQRISIARAILKDSPILVLDEATSALDTESERIVQKALENLMKNRTTLVIAHRLSTVINADKIVVISGGKIAAIGRHAELLEKSEIYSKLYEMQFGHKETDNVQAN